MKYLGGLQTFSSSETQRTSQRSSVSLRALYKGMKWPVWCCSVGQQQAWTWNLHLLSAHSNYWRLVSVICCREKPQKGLQFLSPLTEIWWRSPVWGSGFLTSVQYPALWGPVEDCAGKGWSQELVETHLWACSANKGSFGFSLALFCLNMSLFNMLGGSLGTDFCRIIWDSWPLAHGAVLEISITASPWVK